LCVLALGSASAYGLGFIGWDASIVTKTAAPIIDIAASASSLTAWHYVGDVAIQAGERASGSSLSETGFGVESSLDLPLNPASRTASFDVSLYGMSDLIIDWPVGTWGVIMNASFSLATDTLAKMWTTANVTAYGVSATGTFSLVEATGGFATGLSLGLSGTTLSGMGVFLAADFGIPVPDTLDVVRTLPVADCAFNFAEGSLRLEAFPFGCLHLDVETSFRCAGFNKAEIEFDFELFDGRLAIDGLLSFSTQTQSITLTPYLRLEQGCVWVNIGIDQMDWASTWDNRIDQLVIRGLGISNVEVGSAEVSMIVALGQSLYKVKAASDIDLHASGYYVALAPGVTATRYTLTDYDMVWTMEQGFQNSELTIDVYFGAATGSLLDLALVTADWSHQVSTGLEVSVGLALNPSGAPQTLVLGFNTSAILP